MYSLVSFIVHPLVVSAGENKKLQLPENEVSLSAFTLPKGQLAGKFNKPFFKNVFCI